MATTYAFTVPDNDTELTKALTSLPRGQRSRWICAALRNHLATSPCQAPSLLEQVLSRLGSIEIKISNIGHAPMPPEDIWDDNIDGELLDLDI